MTKAITIRTMRDAQKDQENNEEQDHDLREDHMTYAVTKTIWYFHNDQGCFLAEVRSASRAGAWRIFRKSWGGSGVVCRAA